jgi:hypothetical protein
MQADGHPMGHSNATIHVDDFASNKDCGKERNGPEVRLTESYLGKCRARLLQPLTIH